MQREKVIELWMKASNAKPSGSLEEFARLVELETLEMAAKKIDSVGHHWSGAPAHAFFDLADEIRNLKETHDKE